MVRTELNLPDLAELDVVRHYTRLSTWNFGVDTGMYPLGSCTMKYNPAVNEEAAPLKGFTAVHPLQPLHTVAGCLEALEESQHSWLAYKASMRPVAENYPNSQSAMENLAWFEIDQLRKRIHDLETLDPSLAEKPARRSNTMDDIEKGLSDFGNSMESLFNSGMKKMGLE